MSDILERCPKTALDQNLRFLAEYQMMNNSDVTFKKMKCMLNKTNRGLYLENLHFNIIVPLGGANRISIRIASNFGRNLDDICQNTDSRPALEALSHLWAQHLLETIKEF